RGVQLDVLRFRKWGEGNDRRPHRLLLLPVEADVDVDVLHIDIPAPDPVNGWELLVLEDEGRGSRPDEAGREKQQCQGTGSEPVTKRILVHKDLCQPYE